MEVVESRHRKAPYAPISALHEFFARIRNVGVPQFVDRKFIQRLNVASNNEWALLSALKFLGVIDERGVPTTEYRRLQTTDRFEETLRSLVENSYAELLDLGGMSMTTEDLENYFRVTSSPSQAKNAARFFREVTRMAGLVSEDGGSQRAMAPAPAGEVAQIGTMGASDTRDLVLRAKARLLEKLPEPRADWSAAEYESICRYFLEMLKHLGDE